MNARTNRSKATNKASQLASIPATGGANVVVTPMTMLQSARDSGASLEQMQQLMDMQFKWEENEARKAYNDAVAQFKALDLRVSKDKVNSQFASRYTGIGNLVNTINPELSKFDLSTNWKIEQDQGLVTVTCTMTHKMGHSDSASMTAPADKSGSKNPIQEVKSTITYLKIATYEAVTGVASSDDPGDTDGNIPAAAVITAAQVKLLGKLLQDKGADIAAFEHHFSIEKLEDLPVSKFARAKSMLEAKS